MKTITAITALSVATLGLATQADAFKLSPPSTKFTASGPTKLTANGTTVMCTSTFTGKTTARGTGKITGFTASGADPVCGLITATLPWGAKATSATNIKFTNVAVSIPAAGISCGPGTVNATDNGAGQVTFAAVLNPGNCQVNGTVQSTPPITIVP
ncbi:MAG: activator of alkane oxidation [Caulobacteraceae bacterium]